MLTILKQLHFSFLSIITMQSRWKKNHLVAIWIIFFSSSYLFTSFSINTLTPCFYDFVFLYPKAYIVLSFHRRVLRFSINYTRLLIWPMNWKFVLVSAIDSISFMHRFHTKILWELTPPPPPPPWFTILFNNRDVRAWKSWNWYVLHNDQFVMGNKQYDVQYNKSPPCS